MIIEISGPSGVGKTVLINELIKRFSKCGMPTGAIHSKKINESHLIPEYFSNVDTHNIKTDIYSFPWFILFLLSNLRFCYFALISILINNASDSKKVPLIRSFIRKCGIYRFLQSKKFQELYVFVDEGIIHSSHNFLCSPNYCADDKAISNFYNLCPLPDKLVILNASQEILLKQLNKRGNLSPRVNSSYELINFIKHSHKLFVKLQSLYKSKSLVIYRDVKKLEKFDVVELSFDYITFKVA